MIVALLLSFAAEAGSPVYALTPDARRCASPLCGGAWLDRVNRPRTRCVDGRRAPACYVADVDESALGWSGSDFADWLVAASRGADALIAGPIVPTDYGGFGTLGVLAPVEAWVAWAPRGQTPVASTDPIYRLSYDLRDCLWPLCGGYWVKRVNRPTTRCADGTEAAECYVAEVDWDALGWSAADVAAFSTEAQGGAVLMAGRLVEADYAPYGKLGVIQPSTAWAAWEPAPTP
jgi:hypothetical protein